MTGVFFFCIYIFNKNDHKYSKRNMQQQQKEHVFLSKLKKDCRPNFDGELSKNRK